VTKTRRSGLYLFPWIHGLDTVSPAKILRTALYLPLFQGLPTSVRDTRLLKKSFKKDTYKKPYRVRLYLNTINCVSQFCSDIDKTAVGHPKAFTNGVPFPLGPPAVAEVYQRYTKLATLITPDTLPSKGPFGTGNRY